MCICNLVLINLRDRESRKHTDQGECISSINMSFLSVMKIIISNWLISSINTYIQKFKNVIVQRSIDDCSCRHPLHRCYPNPRLPGIKPVFTTDIMYIPERNNLVRDCFRSQVPRCGQIAYLMRRPL